MRHRHRSRPSGPGAEAGAARRGRDQGVRDRDRGTAEPAERGRQADHPSQIPQSGWRDILLRTWRELGDDHVSLIAAAVAFYGLLALFPAIAALISIWALAFDPRQIEQQIGTFSALLPPDAAAIVKEQAHKVAADVGRPEPRRRGRHPARAVRRGQGHEGADRGPEHHLRRTGGARVHQAESGRTGDDARGHRGHDRRHRRHHCRTDRARYPSASDRSRRPCSASCAGRSCSGSR